MSSLRPLRHLRSQGCNKSSDLIHSGHGLPEAFNSLNLDSFSLWGETGPPITFMWGSSDHLPAPGKIVAKFSLQNGWEITRALNQLEPGINIDGLRARPSSAN
eukprot:228770-Pyramimonas_sp.AAC.1